MKLIFHGRVILNLWIRLIRIFAARGVKVAYYWTLLCTMAESVAHKKDAPLSPSALRWKPYCTDNVVERSAI